MVGTQCSSTHHPKARHAQAALCLQGEAAQELALSDRQQEARVRTAEPVAHHDRRKGDEGETGQRDDPTAWPSRRVAPEPAGPRLTWSPDGSRLGQDRQQIQLAPARSPVVGGPALILAGE